MDIQLVKIQEKQRNDYHKSQNIGDLYGEGWS
jgi:hypothetical protein